MADTNEGVSESGFGVVGSARSGAREFIVEFLGSLVPGGAFLFGFLLAFVVPLLAATRHFFPPTAWSIPALDGFTSASLSTILFLILPAGMAFLLFAYIAGHLFYRQDPKIADEASYRNIPRHQGNDGMVRHTPHGGGTGGTPVEFPYHFLKQYLLDRGICYLAEHVPWDATSFSRRAKHWANALKIRIGLECPHHYGVLARNEAHVRLSSSMWFVCRALMLSAFVGLGVEVVLWIVLRAFGHLEVTVSPAATLPLFVLGLSYLAKRAIEQTLHYQREREILFILEIAHWLCASGRVPNLFAGLEPPCVPQTPPPAGAATAAPPSPPPIEAIAAHRNGDAAVGS
jgi:hypothetical protein